MRPAPAPAAGALLLCLAAAPIVRAQVEYYDVEAGRPLLVQDAYAIERHGWEVQAGAGAAGSSSSSCSSSCSYLLSTTLAYGVLPRTQVELTAPFVSGPLPSGGRTAGLAGLGVGALYNFNAETLTLPALAVAAHVTTTAGSQAPDAPLLSLEGIATRSWPGLRLHLNAATTIGPGSAGDGAIDRSRWFAGAAVDHAWPVQSLLAVAELTAERPLGAGGAVAWSAGAGARYQAAPQCVLDAAVSRRFSGDDPAWMATLGITWSFAVRALMPARP